MADPQQITQVPSPPATPPEGGTRAPSPPASSILDSDPGDGFDEAPIAPEPTPAEPAPEKPKHSARVLRMARDLELDDSYVQSLTPDALEEVVYQLNRQAMLHARQRPETPREQPKPPAEDAIDWGVDDDGKPLTEKDYNPAVARTIKKAHEQDKKLKQLEDELQASRQRDAGRQSQAAGNLIDAAFAALGAGYEKTFGKGSGQTMPATQPELKRRVAVLRAAGITLDNLRPDAVNAQVRDAVEMLYGPAPAKPAEEDAEVKAKKDRWNRGGLAVPTHRDAKEPNGEDGAKKAVAKLLRAKGFETSEDADGDEAELPD